MKDIILMWKIARFVIALTIAVVSWVILSIVLTIFIKNDIAALIISTSFILLTLYLYTKELIRE
ncbi:hypothetical protein [Caminibacter pacificus]|uniref:Uncharacterized protein n=1 Tax=Caminibacter pacificus TaxID=1424653 RepID=A0AAJ4UX86_9BACT|nr:hypothetical protein [Caminibacter pacificus]QCI29107.1 hypothetical protein C6V80_09105 [Caminibacter pacificus]ROR39073.1 hypothetical protein EDC58_1566 [Caminibacter pacificus]